jgi:hypothetical protein
MYPAAAGKVSEQSGALLFYRRCYGDAASAVRNRPYLNGHGATPSLPRSLLSTTCRRPWFHPNSSFKRGTEPTVPDRSQSSTERSGHQRLRRRPVQIIDASKGRPRATAQTWPARSRARSGATNGDGHPGAGQKMSGSSQRNDCLHCEFVAGLIPSGGRSCALDARHPSRERVRRGR